MRRSVNGTGAAGRRWDERRRAEAARAVIGAIADAARTKRPENAGADGQTKRSENATTQGDDG